MVRRSALWSSALAVALMAVAACASGGEGSGEWPCFHGPRRDNHSAETGLLKTWPEGGPKLLWSAKGLGKGYSSVSIAGGLIYTAGMTDKKTYVIVLGLDGRERWRVLNGQSWETRMPHAIGYTGARSTPTCDDGLVYHLSEYGHLICVKAPTGEKVWDRDLFKDFEAETPKYGLAESVLIDGDRLFVSPGGAKGFMVCLHKKTGKLIWACTGVEGTQAYNSPVRADVAGFQQVISMSSKGVFGVDVATGRLLWSASLENMRENNATDPICYKGHVYASSGYGRGSLLVRLDRAGGGVKPVKVWDSKVFDNHHGGVVRAGDHLYGAGHQARGWFCLDFMTGKQAWNAKGKGSLTFAEGMLYCLDERGEMTLVEARPEGYRAVSSFQVPSGGRGLYWAHPVVCGGRLYVRHDDTLFAFDIRAK